MFAAYLMQIGVLTLVGVVLGVALGAAIPLLAAPLIEAALPIPAVVRDPPRAARGGRALRRAGRAPVRADPARAHRGGAARRAVPRRPRRREGALPRRRYLAAAAALLALLVGTAAALSEVPMLAVYTAGAVAAALVVLAGAAWAIRWLARRASGARALRGRTALRLAVGSVRGASGGGRRGGALARARPHGAGGDRADRHQPAPVHRRGTARGRALLLLRGHPARSGRGASASGSTPTRA